MESSELFLQVIQRMTREDIARSKLGRQEIFRSFSVGPLKCTASKRSASEMLGVGDVGGSRLRASVIAAGVTSNL